MAQTSSFKPFVRCRGSNGGFEDRFKEQVLVKSAGDRPLAIYRLQEKRLVGPVRPARLVRTVVTWPDQSAKSIRIPPAIIISL